MREITITPKEANQRLNKYLMKYLNQAPSSFIYKMLRKKNIVLNDKRALGEELIKAGDNIKLYLAEDTILKFRNENIKATNKDSYLDKAELSVLYEDEDIIAVNKPVGILSQKADKDDYSINEMILSYLSCNISDTFKPSVANRLDRNTSGIILAGKSLKGSQDLAKALRERTIDKYYYTIVRGRVTKNAHHTAYIIKDINTNIVNVIPEDAYNVHNGGRIETSYEIISSKNNYTLLKIKLITGKSHQIRAHLAYLGYPVIGDNKYGDNVDNRTFRDKFKLKNQLLHAGEVIFPDGKHIVAKLPEQFALICDYLELNHEEIE